MTLPPALAPWTTALSTIDPKLLTELGPLLRGLDTMIARHSSTGDQGDILDGYSGIACRGTPERILTSEWALADEVPLEFLRRAAGNELLYTAPAYRTDQKRGRVVVLVDTGPDQIGAGRLVQLAALIVLHRRVTARGADLAVGVLGGSTWLDGDLSTMVPAWLKARRSSEPTPADVEAWTAQVSASDELWLLTGPRLARKLPGRPHMLVSTESAWNAGGATSVRVTLAEVTTELPLPEHRTAVRALRGAAAREELQDVSAQPGMHAPLFASAGPQLITRGETDSQLYTLYVPNKPQATVKVRKHNLPGPVLAATYVSGRLVTLVVIGDEVRAHVIGKKLARLDRLTVPLSTLDHSGKVPLWIIPLYFRSGYLLVRLGRTWWRLTPEASPIVENIAAAGPGTEFDRPRIAWRYGSQIFLDGRQRKAPHDAKVVLGHDQLWAWSADGRTWTASLPPLHVDREIVVQPDADVVGVTFMAGLPTLITASRGLRIIHAVTPLGEKELPEWSYAYDLSVHPTKPYIALQRPRGQIEVGDLSTGEILVRLRGKS